MYTVYALMMDLFVGKRQFTLIICLNALKVIKLDSQEERREKLSSDWDWAWDLGLGSGTWIGDWDWGWGWKMGMEIESNPSPRR